MNDPSNAEFYTAWAAFVENIDRVFHAAKGDEANRPIATAQTRYVLASMAIADLLRKVGKAEIAERFHLLAEALNDLVEGTPHPLFSVEQPPKLGRKPDTSAVWRTRSNLAIGMGYLTASGMNLDEVIKYVVKKHRSQLKKLQRPGTELEKSLATWAKSFATDDVTNDVALSSYKLGMRMLDDIKPSHSPNAIKLVGQKLIAYAAERAATKI